MSKLIHPFTYTLILTLFSTFESVSQMVPDEYKFSNEISEGVRQDTTAYRFQRRAVDYSFILDYKRVLHTWDDGFPKRVYQPTASDSTVFKTYNRKDAVDYIVERSRNEEIIIINEAHHLGIHRSFTMSLLKDLYANGYRYLGLEALLDKEINNRNFATKDSGYYTQEPEFANLIYSARKIGFVVFGYEATDGQNGKEREIQQAMNIRDFLSKNKAGKCLIHCGFDHVYENEVEGWEKAMAGRLKELLGIDPFTIDQVRYTEKSTREGSHFFTYAYNTNEPFVLLNSNKEAFKGHRLPPQTDVVVIHPRTTYVHQRPLWFTRAKKQYALPKSALKGLELPIQVLAYRQNEYDKNGIPADYVELQQKDEQPSMYLLPGNYDLIFRDVKYRILKRSKIKLSE